MATWLPQGRICLEKKPISWRAELGPSRAVPLTLWAGSSAPAWPRSLGCAGSQCQSTAELEGPASYLEASENGYLREMFASFKFRFTSALGVASAQFTVPASLLASCVFLQVWRKEWDAEENLVFMHLHGRWGEIIGMVIMWLGACAYWTCSK